jgi:rhamnulokinase
MPTHHLACDLGAESGRLMLGTIADGRLALEELHRFPNRVTRTGNSLHWDIPRLFAELKAGLKKAATLKLPIASISTDSWGVDYVLLDARGEVMPPAFHYRDPRTARGVERVRAKVPWPEVFAETGIQFMPLNTLYQLAAEEPARLRAASRVLMIADAFNFWLGGTARIEESNASTTQLYDPRARQWSGQLLKSLDLPARLFPQIVPSGTRLGPLTPGLARETGLGEIAVIAGCSHDTAAAVAAVPASGENWAYLSSGTWSLLGLELSQPLLTEACRELNFTNEVGFGGSIRLLKNISGLWLVQECRRAWAEAGQDFDYATLTRLAIEAPPFVSLINPADQRFLAPSSMTGAIAESCRQTKQPVPTTPGAFVRCALESLALLYRRTLSDIERLTGRRIERLHIVGGGSRNPLLNQFAANATQLPVLAGPVEATAAGNVLVQAIALGEVPSLSAAREMVAASMPVERIEPRDRREWERAFERFEQLPQ